MGAARKTRLIIGIIGIIVITALIVTRGGGKSPTLTLFIIGVAVVILISNVIRMSGSK